VPTSSLEHSKPFVPWWQGVTPYHALVFLGCWLGGVFDGMDSTLMSVVLPVAVGQLTGSTDKLVISHIGSMVGAVFLLGWMLGGILFGMVGDRLGRVRSMVLSILIYALFTGLAGFAHSWEHLAVCRFLTGLGIGGELVSIATFVAEVWPERTRAIAIGFLITSYQAGVFIAGSLNLFLHDWRQVFFAGTMPALLVVVLRLLLRESDRWVADRSRQAHAPSAGRLAVLFQPVHRWSLVVGGVTFGGLLIGYWASLSWIPTWIQGLLGTAGTGNERAIATMYQGLAAILGCVAAGFMAEAWGRRWTILLSCLGCFAASAVLFLSNPVFSTAVYWESAGLGFFIGLAQAAIYLYLPELFPTRVRATGTGFCLNIGRLATAIAVLFVGGLVAWLGGYARAAFAFSVPYLIAAAAMVVAVETRGQALPD
jgi:MFS family permease